MLWGQEVREFSGPPATLASRSGPASGSCQAPWPPPAKAHTLSGPLPGHLPGFLHRFGRPRDLPGHQKPMIFMILSSKITASCISPQATFGFTFGPLREHFGHHFDRLCVSWGPCGAPWAGKAIQNLSKSRRHGAQSVPKAVRRYPEAPLGAPTGLKMRPRAPRDSPRAQKAIQNAEAPQGVPKIIGCVTVRGLGLGCSACWQHRYD